MSDCFVSEADYQWYFVKRHPQDAISEADLAPALDEDDLEPDDDEFDVDDEEEEDLDNEDEPTELDLRRPMMVRAKVTCEQIEGNNISFRTVYEPDASRDTENARFTTATPWGEIKMGINNPAALEQFAVGESYYVDFTPAAK